MHNKPTWNQFGASDLRQTVYRGTCCFVQSLKEHAIWTLLHPICCEINIDISTSSILIWVTLGFTANTLADVSQEISPNGAKPAQMVSRPLAQCPRIVANWKILKNKLKENLNGIKSYTLHNRLHICINILRGMGGRDARD